VVRVVANLRAMVAGVAVAALALAACSGGGDASPPSGVALGEDGAVGAAFDPDREGPAASIEGAVEGGTVTALSVPESRPYQQTSTMDPTESYYFIPNSILSGLVTRSLTQYVYDPEQGSMVLVPDIATDLGTPNADFTEWSFTIRDGVRFEDGKTVTAEDVAYGIKRSFDRRIFPEGPTYSNEFFLDGDTYKGLYTGGSDYDGVVIEGDTLTIKMERPFPEMPYWGAFPAMGPIPERGSDPDRYALHPMATGPYKFAEFTPGKSLTLVRNEHWNPDTDPGRHAYPERYEFDFAKPWKQIDERDVRQAIGYAWPYQDEAKAIGGTGAVDVFLNVTSILPPGFPGRQDYDVLDVEPGHNDPARAKALLREAGYSPGEYELEFAAYADSVTVDVIVANLEAAGFKATPRMLPPDADLDKFNHDPDAPVNLRIGGWCTDWPSGARWFESLFHSDNDFWAHFAEPAVDTEIERISRLPFQEQPAAWGALDRSIMTDYYPVVVRRYQATPTLHGARIGGVNVDNIYEMPTWKDIYVVQ